MVESIVNSIFSVVIQIPENVAADMKDPPKSISVKFKTLNEKNRYVSREAKATVNALQALASAWTKSQRQAAYLNLYKARNSFCDLFLREELDRLKLVTEPPPEPESA